jgi:hypothetical protein
MLQGMISRIIKVGRGLGMQMDVEKLGQCESQGKHPIKDSDRSITTGECGIFQLCWNYDNKLCKTNT